jgi:hypothetical protein
VTASAPLPACECKDEEAADTSRGRGVNGPTIHSMASDYCLNMNCGHHRKEHKRGTGQCTKCACGQARYTDADKGQLIRRAAAKHDGGRKR